MSIAAFDVIQLVLRLLLAAAFIFMGVTHFLPAVQRTMAAMIPPRIRRAGLLSPRNLVIFTGVCEIAGGIGLVYPPTSVAAGVCLVVFLLAVFPANMHAAAHPERFGRVAIPLVPRLIGQLVLIALVVLAIV
jgi:uncharacterized membrane protein